MKWSAAGLVVLAVFAAAAAVHGNDLVLRFSVEDCSGEPVDGAEVTIYGCVKDNSATILTSKDGLAVSDHQVSYCGTWKHWGCSWTAHKGNIWYSPSVSTIVDLDGQNTSPFKYAKCSCDSNAQCTNSNVVYHEIIVFKPRTCQATHSEVECPQPVHCEGHWEIDMACNATCDKEDGRSSEKFVITKEAQNGGKACEHGNGEVKYTYCKRDMKDCKPGVTPEDCEGHWQVETPCNATCEMENGISSERFNITEQAKNGGKACEAQLGQVKYTDCYKDKKDCTPGVTPEDCEGHWQVETPCNATCEMENGISSERFNITEQAKNGGKACEAQHGQVKYTDCQKEKKDCTPDVTPEDCEGHWEVETPCNATCEKENGISSENFTVTKQAKNGGKACEAQHGQVKYTDCKKDKKDCTPEPCDGKWKPELSCSATCEKPDSCSSEKYCICQEKFCICHGY